MRTDIPATVSRDGLIVQYWVNGTPQNLIVDTGGLTSIDLGENAASITQSDSQTQIRLVWEGSRFSGGNRPQIGRPISIQSPEPFTIWNGIVDSVGAEIKYRGKKELTLTCRSRDSTPWWREMTRLGPAMIIGTDLAAMVRELCEQLGLSRAEYNVPDSGIISTHGFVQLADHSAWKMMTDALVPSLQEPWVDARGIFRPISRDVRRKEDLILRRDQVQSTESGASNPPYARVRVKWADPELIRLESQAGLIQLGSPDPFRGVPGKPLLTKPVKSRVARHTGVGLLDPSIDGDPLDWFSWDEKNHARADNISLVFRSPLYNGSIDITQRIPEQGGPGHVGLSGYFPSFLQMISPQQGFICPVRSRTTTGGGVFPAGTPNEALNDDNCDQATWEIYGQLFDYATAINEQEAVDRSATIWMTKVLEIANDLIPTRAVGRSVAVNELFYSAYSSSKAKIRIVDDLRIERGDILLVPDPEGDGLPSRRLYVESYQRTLTRGGSNFLDVNGFWADPICR